MLQLILILDHINSRLTEKPIPLEFYHCLRKEK